ncbi:MAG: 25S rRNA (uracil2634-N3)-methyltransferase, partial [Oleiphilaceae bacterium]
HPVAIRKTYFYFDLKYYEILMLIKSNWRILTIGDGDLSFSASLWQTFKPKKLTATVFDSQKTLEDKYQHHAIKQLQTGPSQQVLFGFDVTNPDSWPDRWLEFEHQKFDLVLFQFPLVPAFEDTQYFHNKGDISINTLNRLLLRQYLIHCVEYFLDPNGKQLCCITSKDVKPYNEWNIESSLNQDLEHIKYLGSMNFDIKQFPGYRIRNVDRDKHVKNSQGITYVWSPKTEPQNHDKTLLKALKKRNHFGQEDCEICKAGPFVSVSDKTLHEQTKKHQLMQQYEKQYTKALLKTYN